MLVVHVAVADVAVCDGRGDAFATVEIAGLLQWGFSFSWCVCCVVHGVGGGGCGGGGSGWGGNSVHVLRSSGGSVIMVMLVRVFVLLLLLLLLLLLFVLVLLVDIHVGGLTGAAGTRAGVAAMIVSSCLSCGALVVIVVAPS